MTARYLPCMLLHWFHRDCNGAMFVLYCDFTSTVPTVCDDML